MASHHYHHHHHALPFSSPQPRTRRSRRLVRRSWTPRCSASVLLLLSALLYLAYLSFSGRRLPSHSDLHMEHNSSADGLKILESINVSVEVQNIDKTSSRNGPVSSGLNLDLYNDKGLSTDRTQGENSTLIRKYRRPPRKYLPCQIDFLESVNHIVEPRNYLSFTQFSLEYIDQEISHGNDIFEHKFGGHQTLEERENSFYARNQTLHCGFVKGPKGYPSTGFDLSDKDKEYMHSCKVVVSSCIFGSSDFLRRPASSKIGAYSKNHVCFIMFLDELTMSQLTSEGNVPDDRGSIGLWRLVLVRNLPYTDMRKTGKVPKFLSHRLFPSARYSIWIDSKMRLNADPLLILEYFLWRKRSEYAISNHYDRHCVWEEVLQNKRLNKYNHTAIDEQFLFYQSDGLVKFDGSDMNIPLPSYVPEGSFIVRAHTPMSNLFSCLWFNEVDRFTSRDQLSFGYTFLKLHRMNPGKTFHLNMFKDCERRRLAKLYHHRGGESRRPPHAL